MLQEKHEHLDKLPGVKLPADMKFTTDLKEAIEGKIENIEFKLVSSDYINFDLLKID